MSKSSPKRALTAVSARATASAHKRWLSGSVWAIAEQGMFSLSHFLLNIGWARILTSDEYGAFVSTFALYLLLGAAHSAFFCEPLLVFSLKRFSDRSRSYASSVFKMQAAFGACAVLLLVTAAWFLKTNSKSTILDSILGLSVAILPLLSTQILRRTCYAWFRPLFAAIGAAVYLATNMVALLLALKLNWHTALAAYAGITLAAVFACATMLLGLSTVKSATCGEVARRSTAALHWIFGRFNATSIVLSWLAINSYYLLLPMVAGPTKGLAESGALRAIMTLVMPLIQLNATLGAMLIPLIARQRHERQSFMPRKFLLTFLLVDGGYCLLLALSAQPALHWVYAGKYDAFAPILQVLCLYPLLSGIGHIFRAQILACERPKFLILPSGMAAVASLTSALCTYPIFGLTGIAGAILLGVTVQTFGMGWIARSKRIQSYTRSAPQHEVADKTLASESI